MSQAIPPHIERVIAEKDLLSDNYNKLTAYIDNGAPGSSDEEKVLLNEQQLKMASLIDTFNKRIALHVKA